MKISNEKNKTISHMTMISHIIIEICKYHRMMNCEKFDLRATKK